MTPQPLSEIIFWILGALALGSACLAVVTPNTLYSGLSLMLLFFVLAILYLWMGQEYFSAMQLLIYVGAIMVLFIFMIMLLNTREDKEPFIIDLRRLVAFFCFLGFVLPLIPLAISFRGSLPPTGDYNEVNIAQTGASELFAEELFGKSALIIELVAILLLVGVLGAVVLTKKDYSDRS